MQHGFVCVSPVLVVNGQSPEVFKPGESALYNPSFWHGKKSVRVFVRPEYDIQVTTQQSLRFSIYYRSVQISEIRDPDNKKRGPLTLSVSEVSPNTLLPNK